MTDLKKIVGINLAILLGYGILARLADSGSGHDKGLGFMVLMASAVVLHVVVNVIGAIILFIGKKSPEGRAFLLSALLVAIIGFSACWGLASTY
jgi:hypothetical protein